MASTLRLQPSPLLHVLKYRPTANVGRERAVAAILRPTHSAWMLVRQSKTDRASALSATLIGAMFGALIEGPAVVAAISSAGAGHGSYIAARVLFPLPMLLTLVEGEIGPVAAIAALLQFPIYGALFGWSIWRRKPFGAAILVSLHVVAAGACFGGALPTFSP